MIRKLEVENYKSIESCQLKFEEINVLIGKNGAGKTTLISIINMLKKLASGSNINAVVNEVAPFGEFFNANAENRQTKFSLEIQTPKQELFSYSFMVSFDNPPEAIATFSFVSESLYKVNGAGEEELVFKRVNGAKSKIVVRGSNGENEEIPLKVDQAVLMLSTYAQEETKSVADTLSSYSIIWVGNSRNAEGFEIVNSNNPNLGTIDGVAVGLFLKDRGLFNEAIGAIKSIIPGFTPPEINRIPSSYSANSEKTDAEDGHNKFANYIVSWSDSEYSKSYGVSRMSLSGGNNRVIFLILSLYNSNAQSCFVAEEIENGMHLSRIAKLIDQMRMIVKKRKIQLFFTTHNHLILDDLLPKEIIFVRLGDDGSKYVRLSETEEYKEIKNDLGRPPSSTEVVNSGLLFS